MTYSGLIGLVMSIIGSIAGLFFVIFVTRRLGPEDFGLWTLIGSLVGYMAIVEPIINTWSPRQIARGDHVGKTILAGSTLLSTVGLFGYSIVVVVISSLLHANFYVLLLSSAIVPLNFLNNSLSAMSIGFKPQSVSYGSLVFETSKIPLGLFFVVFSKMGMYGVLITVIGASSIRLIVLLILVRSIIIGSIKTSIIKFWIRMSWLTLYSSSAGLLRSLDTLIFSLITNSFVGLAFWGAAMTVSGNIGQFASLSQGLYPKLLATGKKEFAEENIKLTIFLTLPFLGLSIVFAKPILYVINPAYQTGILVLIILSIRSFIGIIMDIYFNILRAYETVDLDQNASFHMFIKSKLFLIPTLNYILYGSYIGSLAVLLIICKGLGMSELSLVTIWAIIFLFLTIPFTIYGILKVRKEHSVKFPFSSTSKYGIMTLISSIIIYFIFDHAVVYSSSIWIFLPRLIPLFLLYGGIYFALCYVFDKSSRTFLKSIISGFIGKI